MKVAFDDRPAGGPSGIARYTNQLLHALRALAPERDGEMVLGHRPRKHKVDCFHSPWIDGALLRPPVPTIVTLHDLIPLKRPGLYLRSGLKFRMRYLAVGRADRVIVPTAAVAEDAARLLDLTDDRVHVIPEAAAPVFSPRDAAAIEKIRRRYDLPDDYLVWVGGLKHPDPRKRVAALAATKRDLPLVLVGDAGQWAKELAGVTLTGAVPDEDLAAIYSGAHALVFPSDEEGFGLPPVEALACGTPVVASDVPALREVLGDRATLVDPSDLNALIAAAVRATRPAPKPPNWTWENAADATWMVYEKAAGRKMG